MGGTMSSITINGDTSGSVILQAPSIAGSTTLTLPSTSGTVITTNTIPAGQIVQVVSATTTSITSTTSTSYVDTTLSASITPKSSSNKILVLVTGNTNVNKLTATNYGDAFLSVLRGATRIVENRIAVNFGGTSWTDFISGMPLSYLDSPATTSSTTYKVQLATSNATVVFPVNGTAYGTITLLEVAV